MTIYCVVPEAAAGDTNGCGLLSNADASADTRLRIFAGDGVTYGNLMTRFNTAPPGPDDIFAHIDEEPESDEARVSSANDKRIGGGVFMLNALRGETRRDDYYPDMLFKHPFAEAEGKLSRYAGLANYFRRCNVHFFIISGRGGDIVYGVSQIIDWLIVRSGYELYSHNPALSDDETALVNDIAARLRLTKTMRAEFIQLAEKFKRRNGGLARFIFDTDDGSNIDMNDIQTNGVLNRLSFITADTVNTKAEAKAAYARLKRSLSE